MSTAQALVLRDSEGHFYVIPPAVLEASRVPAEQPPALADEVAGHIAYVTNPAVISNLDRAPFTPSYSYSYSYGPNGYSYAYAYTLPSLPTPGARAPGQIVGV